MLNVCLYDYCSWIKRMAVRGLLNLKIAWYGPIWKDRVYPMNYLWYISSGNGHARVVTIWDGHARQTLTQHHYIFNQYYWHHKHLWGYLKQSVAHIQLVWSSFSLRYLLLDAGNQYNIQFKEKCKTNFSAVFNFREIFWHWYLLIAHWPLKFTW